MSNIPMIMETLSAWLLSWLGEALILGTLLAALTWLAVRVLRGRTAPAIAMVLWTMVLIKFLVPGGPAWSFSLASLYDTLTQQTKNAVTARADAETGLTAGRSHPGDLQAEAVPTKATGHANFQTVFVSAYLLGVTFLAAIKIGSYYRFRRRCMALIEPDEATRELVNVICARLGVWPLPTVRISDEHRAPFVIGIVRPLLVLSRRHLVRPDELETVIIHEITHLRRSDLLVRCLQCIAGTVLFFWPVVYWVNRHIDEAREHACDEGALRHGKLTASEYATCLLTAARPAPLRRFVFQPACMASRISTIERRIDMILATPDRPGRPIVWGFAVTAFLAGWCGFALTGAVGGEAGAKYGLTEQEMFRHADEVYAHIKQYPSGDIDGNGEITKQECWAFVTAIALQNPEAFLEEYPLADQDNDGTLAPYEAYLFLRGDYELQNVDKEMQFEIQEAKKSGDEALAKQIKEQIVARRVEVWHVILDRRDQIVSDMAVVPDAETVKAIASKMDSSEKKKKTAESLLSAIAKVAEFREKAELLKQKALEFEGEKAKDLLEKAKQLELRAHEIKAEIVKKFKEELSKLEASGMPEKAAILKETLDELESY